MSISPTRRVGLSSPASAVEKAYTAKREEEFRMIRELADKGYSNAEIGIIIIKL